MEAGYAWHPLALDFDAARAERDDDARPAPIRPAPIDLGALDLSGPILRFGALLRL
jgi:hypothetical protein